MPEENKPRKMRISRWVPIGAATILVVLGLSYLSELDVAKHGVYQWVIVGVIFAAMLAGAAIVVRRQGRRGRKKNTE